MKPLRAQVVDLMVEIHLVPVELAAEHVSRMDDVEIARRFEMYTGTELSAADDKTEGRACIPSRVVHVPDEHGTLAALNPVSVEAESAVTR